jgi:hypothetical protein
MSSVQRLGEFRVGGMTTMQRFILPVAASPIIIVAYVVLSTAIGHRDVTAVKDECHYILFHKPGKTGSTTIGDALRDAFLREGYVETLSEGPLESNLESAENMVCREKKLFTHSHLMVEDTNLLRWRSCCNVVMITSIRSPLDRMVSEYFHVRKEYVEAWNNGSKALVAENFATWYRTLNHDRHVVYMLGLKPETSIADRFDFIFENSAITTDCERFSAKYGVTLACDRRARASKIDNYDVISYLRRSLPIEFNEIENERTLYDALFQERLHRIYK